MHIQRKTNELNCNSGVIQRLGARNPRTFLCCLHCIYRRPHLCKKRHIRTKQQQHLYYSSLSSHSCVMKRSPVLLQAIKKVI